MPNFNTRNRNRIPDLLTAALLATVLSAAPRAAESHAPREPAHGEIKSEWVAYGAAAAGTAVPIAVGAMLLNSTSNGYAGLGGGLLMGGVLLGPSSGQFYANSTMHGFLSSGVRTVGGLMFFAGALNSMTSMSCLEREPGEPPCESKSGAGVLTLLGAVTYLGGTVYSLVDTHKAVVRTHAQTGLTYGVTPTLALNGDGRSRYGGQAWLRF